MINKLGCDLYQDLSIKVELNVLINKWSPKMIEYVKLCI